MAQEVGAAGWWIGDAGSLEGEPDDGRNAGRIRQGPPWRIDTEEHARLRPGPSSVSGLEVGEQGVADVLGQWQMHITPALAADP
jgi:hypothetical protein